MTALLHRTSSDLASMSRAAQRKQRLLEIEKEQRLEDAEVLKMTEVRVLPCSYLHRVSDMFTGTTSVDTSTL
jgi:hypothetical protein